MILISNKSDHYIAIGNDEKSFKLMYMFEYLNINYENGYLYLSTESGSNFYIDKNGFLRSSTYYIYHNNEKETVLLISESNEIPDEKKVRANVENFDFKQIAFRGSYSAIFSPSITGNNDNITRVCMQPNRIIIPDDKKILFQDFCLFPLSEIQYDNFSVSEYKKCINLHMFRDYASKTTLITFLSQFRRMWLGIKTFEKNKMFHSDIKMANIVIDDGNFKLIDFDLSFFTDTLSNQNDLFRCGKLYCIFPTIPNLLATTYVARKLGLNRKITDHSYQERVSYTNYFKKRCRYYGIENLLIENLPNVIAAKDKYHKLMENITTLEQLEFIFTYISIYQLAESMINFIIYYRTIRYKDVILEFLQYCLDFETNGFVTIDSVIERYDILIEKINIMGENIE